MLAILAVLAVLTLGRAFFMPIVAAILLHFLLSPPVRALSQRGVPSFLATAVLLLSIGAAVGFGAYRLVTPALEAMQTLPQALHEVRHKTERWLRPVEQVTAATESVEELANVGSSDEESVTVRPPSLAENLWQGARDLVTGSVLSLVLLYFLIAVDDAFLRKLVEAVPSLAGKRSAVDLIRGIEREVSRYLMTISSINLGLGVAVGLALWWFDYPNPALWGLMAAVLNFVPYLGAVVGMFTVGLVGLTTFDSPGHTLTAVGIYVTLTAVEGTFITPTMLGRRLALSPVVVFVWLMLWNWLWGVPGVLMAVPLLVVILIFCDHVPELEPVARVVRR